ncbi:MAG: hypothetical protein AB1Z98_37775 [Nannocystaceae bacterium]
MSGASATEIEADEADVRHREALDERLRSAAAAGVRDWQALLVAADGADPRLVARRVAALRAPVTEPPTEPPATPPWTPELHALDFEWYFEPACATELAAHLLETRVDRGTVPGAVGAGGVLCLGTPTVAFALLADPRCPRVTLVDANPLAAQRGPSSSLLHSINDDLAAARIEAGRYDAAIFDAPWYPAELLRWLAVAARGVRMGGRIMFVLPRPLHRPRAPEDRRQVLEAARRLGPVTVQPGRLRYSSPRFEREALATAGVRTPAAWRRADLVELVLHREPGPIPPAPSARPPWRRFVVGSQVVHLDLSAPDLPGDPLAPLPGTSSHRYASISTRDPLRDRIGLWTSRSRVAQVRRPAFVAALLEHLAQAGDLRGLERTPQLRASSTEERRRVLASMRSILGSGRSP